MRHGHQKVGLEPVSMFQLFQETSVTERQRGKLGNPLLLSAKSLCALAVAGRLNTDDVFATPECDA